MLNTFYGNGRVFEGSPPTRSRDASFPRFLAVGRRSPRSDEQDLEGAVLASADATDISSGVGQPEPPMALARSTGRGADADSRGYERDVGETTSSPSNRRPSTLAVISPPGVSAKASTAWDQPWLVQ